MRKEIIVSLVAVVLVAGCVQFGGGEREVDIDMNNGLVINEFSVSDNRILDDESVIFYLEVENKGGTTAENIEARISGLSGWDTQPDSKSTASLSPPDLSVQPPMPGDFKIFQWELEAPSQLGEGAVPTYTATARVTYHYKTSAAITIPGYSETEYRRRSEQGKGKIDTISVSNTEGVEGSGGAPVKVDITPKREITFDTEEDQDETMSYRLLFNNVGSGVPFGENQDGEQEDGIITGTVQLSGPVEFGECLGQTGGNQITINPEDVKIRKGESVKKLCEIKVLNSEWGEASLNTISLTFNLDYNYYVDESTTVTVVGQ